MSDFPIWPGPVMLTFLNRVRGDETDKPMRSDVVVGRMTDVLQVGRGLRIIAPPETEYSAARLVDTSPVQTIIKNDDFTYTFRTNNSIYRLDFLPETDASAAN
jgi:hypothetical protein